MTQKVVFVLINIGPRTSSSIASVVGNVQLLGYPVAAITINSYIPACTISSTSIGVFTDARNIYLPSSGSVIDGFYLFFPPGAATPFQYSSFTPTSIEAQWLLACIDDTETLTVLIKFTIVSNTGYVCTIGISDYSGIASFDSASISSAYASGNKDLTIATSSTAGDFDVSVLEVSYMPTSAPSLAPINKPTVRPSCKPSANPTTAIPSLNPSPTPSNLPTTQTPSSNPSPVPTQHPTANPSCSPSSNPSPVPTEYPTPYPSLNPTNNPSPHPTQNPTTNPSCSPSPAPSENPTPYPSPNPTNNPSPIPSENPTQIPSPNFLSIFGGLSVNSSVDLAQAVISIEPFDKKLDKLSMNNHHASGNGFSSLVSGGSLIISNVNNKHVHISEWNAAINMPSYKLNVDEMSPKACANYINGLHKRIFYIQIIDRYGRRSNVFEKHLKVETAIFIVTNANSMKITNGDPYYVKLDVSAENFLPSRLNLTALLKRNLNEDT
eukprot:gene5105-7117_t